MSETMQLIEEAIKNGDSDHPESESESSREFTEVTPEIAMPDEVYFLVRVNKKELMLLPTKEQAILAVDSLASAFVRELESDECQIFRCESQDESKITISRKDLGTLFHSSVYKVMTIDFLPVGMAIIKKGRRELKE